MVFLKKGTGFKIKMAPTAGLPLHAARQAVEPPAGGRLFFCRNKKRSCCKNVLRGRHLFEKRFSSPPPHLPNTFDGIAFIVNDKNNSNFFINDQKSSSIKHNVEQWNK